MGYRSAISKPPPRASIPNYGTDSYLARQSLDMVLLKERREAKKPVHEKEPQAWDYSKGAQEIIKNSFSREEAIVVLADGSKKREAKFRRELTPEIYSEIKSVNPETNYGMRAASVLLALGLPATAVGIILEHYEKINGWSVSAESLHSGRAAPANWTELVNLYQNLGDAMNAALIDNQLSFSERADIQAKAEAIKQKQTAEFLGYLDALIKWQGSEGENFTNISKYDPPRFIDWINPSSEWDKPSLALRYDILPARDENLQYAGVDKASAANASSINRIASSMKEVIQEHQKNDAAMQKMIEMGLTPLASKVSNIGTTPLKTAAPLLKIMKQIQNPDADKNSLAEELESWLESPDAWDFVNGVWTANPVEVLRAARDLYAEKLAPAQYYIAVSDWAPIHNTPPIIDGFNISKEAKTKSVYETRVIATDANNDQLTFALLKAPKGMSIDSKTGKITWSPAFENIGLHDVSVQVSDRTHAVKYDYQLNVTSGNHAPEVDEKNIKLSGLTRNAYAQQIIAGDFDGDDLTFKLIAGPKGMSINNAGMLGWAPDRNQTGNFSVVVEVSDGENATRLNYTLRVDSDNSAPSILSAPKLQVKIGNRWEYAVNATDSDGDPLTYELYLYKDLVKKDSKGIFNWSPQKSDVGKVPYKIIVRDNFNASEEQSGEISVISNNAPQIPSAQKIFIEIGKQAKIILRGTDPDAEDKLTYKIKQAPEGVVASVDESGNLTLEGFKKSHGEIKLSLSDGIDEVEFSVPYEVKEKVIPLNMIPYYVAAAAMISAGTFGGLYGGYRKGRRVNVQQLLAIDNSGRLMGNWNEKGVPIKGGQDDIISSMVIAINDFTSQGLGGSLNVFDYTLPIVGRPRLKFVIEKNDRMTIAAVVGTSKAKKIRRVGRALQQAVYESSPSLPLQWDGDRDSLQLSGMKAVVEKNVYGKELSFSEFVKELFGADKEVEIATAPVVPVVQPQSQQSQTQQQASQIVQQPKPVVQQTVPSQPTQPTALQAQQQNPPPRIVPGGRQHSMEIPPQVVLQQPLSQPVRPQAPRAQQPQPMPPPEQTERYKNIFSRMPEKLERVESLKRREQFGDEYLRLIDEFNSGTFAKDPEFNTDIRALLNSVNTELNEQNKRSAQPPPPPSAQSQSQLDPYRTKDGTGETELEKILKGKF